MEKHMEMTKAELRRTVLELRSKLPKEQWIAYSREIHQILRNSSFFSKAEIILCYADYRNEVETKTFISQCLAKGKKVFCPKVEQKEMEFYEIKNLSELQEGFRGILEPDGNGDTAFFHHIKKQKRLNADNDRDKILMIMPGAVYDKNHHRIGYGGGYYDKYIEKCNLINLSVNTVALGFSFQVLPCIPTEKHDICPMYIVTEKGIF